MKARRINCYKNAVVVKLKNKRIEIFDAGDDNFQITIISLNKNTAGIPCVTHKSYRGIVGENTIGVKKDTLLAIIVAAHFLTIKNNSMTNEDILKQEEGNFCYSASAILSAMTAARQDEREKMAGDAVAFMEWAAGAGWQTYDGPDRWICTQENKRVVTTAELYKLFKSKQ